MKIALMQPTFMPWQGFFELIYKSDVFIILDDFQFSYRSFHQRNKLFTSKYHVDWYTVPVKKNNFRECPINRIEINDSSNWVDKFLKRIDQNYCRSEYFNNIYPVIKNLLLSHDGSLVNLNVSIVKLICNFLEIDRKFKYSSSFRTISKRSQRILDILKLCNATSYCCARGSFGYMQEDGLFPVENITLLFQDFKPKEYLQVGSPEIFVPYLSIIDALMNVGPEKTFELVASGTKHWLSWNEMREIYEVSQLSEKGVAPCI